MLIFDVGLPTFGQFYNTCKKKNKEENSGNFDGFC